MNFIRINQEVLVSWFWNSALSMARLLVHQIVKQNNKKCSCCFLCCFRNVQLVMHQILHQIVQQDNKKCSCCFLCCFRNVQLVMVHQYNLLTMSSDKGNFFHIVALPKGELTVSPRFDRSIRGASFLKLFRCCCLPFGKIKMFCLFDRYFLVFAIDVFT